MDDFFVVFAAIATIVFATIGLFIDPKESLKTHPVLVISLVIGIALSSAGAFINSQISGIVAENIEAIHQQKILKSIWESTNEVSASNVSVIVTATFIGGQNEEAVNPLSIYDGFKATLNVCSRKAECIKYVGDNSWDISPLTKEPDVSISSGPSERFISKFPRGRGGTWEIVGIFKQFTGDLNSFTSPENWNNSIIELHISGRPHALNDAITYLIRASESHYSLPEIPLVSKDSEVNVFEYYKYNNYQNYVELFQKIGDKADVFKPIPALLKAQVFIGKKLAFVQYSLPFEYNFRHGVTSDLHAKFIPHEVDKDLFYFPVQNNNSSNKESLYIWIRYGLFTVISFLMFIVCFRFWGDYLKKS